MSMQNPQLQNRNGVKAITFQPLQQACWIRKISELIHNIVIFQELIN